MILKSLQTNSTNRHFVFTKKWMHIDYLTVWSQNDSLIALLYANKVCSDSLFYQTLRQIGDFAVAFLTHKICSTSQVSVRYRYLHR